MDNKVEKLKGTIDVLKRNQRLSRIMGIGFFAGGLIEGTIHLLSPQPEDIIDYLSITGLLIIGLTNLFVTHEYKKALRKAKTIEELSIKNDQIYRVLKKRIKVEEALSNVIGPNILLLRVVYPNRGVK